MGACPEGDGQSISGAPLDADANRGSHSSVECGKNAEVTIAVLLIDDHEVVRRGVAELLSADGDIAIVAQAGTAAEARTRVVEAEQLDVAVVDVRLPDGDGIDLCGELRHLRPGLRCVVLTAYEDDDALLDAHAAGVHAYLLKEVRGTDLLRAVRTVARGATLLDPNAVKAARDRVRLMRHDQIADLTPQERRVFDLLGAGHTNREIAHELGLAEKTIKNYMTGLLMKLRMERRTEVAALAARLDERGRRRSA